MNQIGSGEFAEFRSGTWEVRLVTSREPDGYSTAIWDMNQNQPGGRQWIWGPSTVATLEQAKQLAEGAVRQLTGDQTTPIEWQPHPRLEIPIRKPPPPNNPPRAR